MVSQSGLFWCEVRDLVLTLAHSHNKSVLSWFTTSKCQETSSLVSTFPKGKAMAKAITITSAKARGKAMAKAIVIITVKAKVKFSAVAKTNAESTSIPADISHSKVSWEMVKDWLPSHPLKNFDES